jgi:hypothetical protein
MTTTNVVMNKKEGGAMNRRPYRTPEISVVGKYHQLTQTKFNKIGTSSDIYSAATPLVGSLKAV